MITFMLRLLRLLPFLVGGHCQLALENLALRQQLDVYTRTMARPPLRRTDRRFWVVLARVWTGWRRPLVIVTPNTVLRWQRRRFREYWTKLSARPTGGRPPRQRRDQSPGQPNGRGESTLGRPANPCRAPQARHRPGRAHRLPADAEASSPAITDLAHVPCQPCPRSRFPPLLHRPHRRPARTIRSRRTRSPPPTGRPFQRDRASHRLLGRPADRGRLPRRFRTGLPPARPRRSLR